MFVVVMKTFDINFNHHDKGDFWLILMIVFLQVSCKKLLLAIFEV